MSRQRYILIAILFFHTVNTYMDRVCIASAKGGIIKDLGITDEMMGWIFGVFNKVKMQILFVDGMEKYMLLAIVMVQYLQMG